MGVSYLSVSAFCTVLSYVGLQCWMGISVEKLKSDGLIGESIINFGNESRALENLLGSHTTIALGANFAVNVFILLVLFLKLVGYSVSSIYLWIILYCCFSIHKGDSFLMMDMVMTIFFGDLHSSEIRKLAERLINYVISKGTFLPLVVPPTLYQAGLWSTWLAVLCFLKMFQALARDRLERLNASPSATPWSYFRVYSALLLVLSANLLWMRACLIVYKTISSSLFLLLFFEPLSIAFETLQAILVHGFQLLDIYIHDSANDITNSRISKLFDISAAGSFGEWKGVLIRNMGFLLDMMTLLMALAHYVHIWWLHGMAFHLVDAILFLNIRALLSAIVKRVKGFIKLRIALGTLHGALPDATLEELQTYDDECAICREPMAKAKKLSCNHLFHLACLRSWLDQGLTENYSCPTCRKPLFIGRSENEVNPQTVDVRGDELLAREMSMGLDQLNLPGHALQNEASHNQMHNPLESSDWRGSGVDSGWLGLDGAGPSTGIRSASLGRVQTVMRHLAAVGETYAQTALEDAAWNLWSMRASQAGTSSSAIPPAGSVRHVGGAGGLHLRTTSRATNNNIPNIHTMVETVREVLPHIPDEIIFEDLQRTHSVTVTVNNLLHM